MSEVLGIDPSLNSTGVAYRGLDGSIRASCISPSGLKGIPRILRIRNIVDDLLFKLHPRIVVLEGYALGFRGKSNTIFDIGELGGTLKILVLSHGIDILLVPPNNLKLFATGKGNADKSLIADVLHREHGLSFSKSDQYDAAGLLMMGEGHVNRRILPRDLRHYKRRALAGCSILSHEGCMS